MLTSQLTQKGQATIPAPIRKFLSLNTGDPVNFTLKDNQVTITKGVTTNSPHYLKTIASTLEPEWNSPEDSQAYDNL